MNTNLRSVDLNLLTVFDAILQEGSLSAAGDALGMTQPAVSNAVSRLRITFADELFLRNRYGMSPTPRAQALAEPVREALGILQNVFDPAGDFDPTNTARCFKLAIGDYGELVLLPRLLKLFSRYGGNLSVETLPALSADSLAKVRQGQVDFYFDYKPPKYEQLEHALLGNEEAVVIARKDHPMYKRKLSQQDYLDAHHIVLMRNHRQTLMERIWDEQPVRRKIMAEVMQYAAMPELVTQSDCLATVPRGMAEYYARLHPISIHPLPFEFDSVPVYIIWHRAFERDKGHAWLKQILLGYAAIHGTGREPADGAPGPGATSGQGIHRAVSPPIG